MTQYKERQISGHTVNGYGTGSSSHHSVMQLGFSMTLQSAPDFGQCVGDIGLEKPQPISEGPPPIMAQDSSNSGY